MKINFVLQPGLQYKRKYDQSTWRDSKEFDFLPRIGEYWYHDTDYYKVDAIFFNEDIVCLHCIKTNPYESFLEKWSRRITYGMWALFNIKFDYYG